MDGGNREERAAALVGGEELIDRVRSDVRPEDAPLDQPAD